MKFDIEIRKIVIHDFTTLCFGTFVLCKVYFCRDMKHGCIMRIDG